ncbi:hypothetical protein QWZ08_26785 [Ferruginibacter paludis]|uniref:hypothetical protein n=1 Tax=Ferruginibacter paludis TaxID=1310417 RepID=UPI0025B52DF7|nr:hypothetical protein [Ferruginibacter paludis]MDN3659280.1 hypothetical protein [Ferruginibacter paludis]
MIVVEIIALVFLCRHNGFLAERKGLSATKWKWYTVAAWLAAELAGLLFGMALFGMKDLYALSALALISAFGGFLYINALLKKMPDDIEEDVNKIGISDLQPPRKEERDIQ